MTPSRRQMMFATAVVSASTAFAATLARAATALKLKMTTAIPAEITTPDVVQTRLGAMKFFDGYPDPQTTQLVYDNLDFQRGVQTFLTCIPGASCVALRHAFRELGPDNETVVLFETLMDSKGLFLTGNTESVYGWGWLNLKDGPMVLETPPRVLGMVDDFWFRNVVDFGNAGPDQGKGGKFLIIPPGWKGDIPEGYFVAHSPTINNLYLFRGFLVDGSPKPAAGAIKQIFKIYPLGKDASASKVRFVNGSGRTMNTVHANNYHFYEEVDQIVQEEPNSATDPETLGLLAAIGMEKGKPFAPDARMKKILVDAAAVGNATSRAISFEARGKDFYLYPNSAWNNPLAIPKATHRFDRDDGLRLHDMRTYMFYYATGNTPAMILKRVGVGSQYAIAFKDSKGQRLDGAQTYKLHLPPNIPAKDFWSVVVYDNQTRSMLQTDQQFPSMGSQNKGVVINPDTSADIYFGPTPPAGKASNWVQTVPGKGWNIILRMYGPLEPWFEKTWRPGEIEKI